VTTYTHKTLTGSTFHTEGELAKIFDKKGNLVYIDRNPHLVQLIKETEGLKKILTQLVKKETKRD